MAELLPHVYRTERMRHYSEGNCRWSRAHWAPYKPAGNRSVRFLCGLEVSDTLVAYHNPSSGLPPPCKTCVRLLAAKETP